MVVKICCCSVTKLYLTLCNPVDCSTPDFPDLPCLPPLLSSYTGSQVQLCMKSACNSTKFYDCPQIVSRFVFTKVQASCVCMLSHLSPVWLSVTPWTADCHAPLSTGFSRKEYWSGLPFPPPGNPPDPGIKPTSLASPALQANSSPLSHWGSLH